MSRADDFESIMTDTHSAVRAYIAGLGVPLDYVDDIAQELYLDFYGVADSMPPDVEPLRWLKGMARKRCLNYFRQRKKSEERMMEAVAELFSRAETPWEGRAAGQTAQDALEDCLDKSPERTRRIVALRYDQGQTSAEMAPVLDMTAEAVRVALMRIRAALKKCVERVLAG